MLKKILYVIVSIVIGFVVFFISWRDSYSNAVINKGQKALENEDYEFFLKFLNYYEKEEITKVQYTFDDNTTTIRAYNVYSKDAVDKDKNKVYRSGVLLMITDINLELIKVDTEEPTEDVKDEDPATRITFTADTGSTITTTISTYGYDKTPIVLFTYSTTESIADFKTKDYPDTPTKITHIKMADSENTVFYDCDINIDLVEHNDEEYWKNLVSEGKAGVTFTPKEARSYFTFSFPEMNKTIIVTLITFLIFVGLGVFVFWPKKSYVPTEEVDRETYTFASTDEKEKYALAKIAKGKKEKEDRENRYKNVRSESNLENMSNKAIIDSIGKENTAEEALKADEEALKEAEDKTIDSKENEENKEEN